MDSARIDSKSFDLKGKVAFITGGTSGIGKATAIEFARRGAHVVFTGRRAAEGQAVADQVRTAGAAAGVKAVFVQGDVSNDADIRRAVDEALKLTGKLDFAFNNAGVEGLVGTPTIEQTEANYDHVMNINVKGVLLSLKHEIRAMLASGGGSIINNASIAGSIGMPGMSVYIASKHAVLGLTKTAALEVAKNNIRVNAVSPAAIETEMYDRFATSDDARNYMASLHPIGRVGKAEEIAKAVVFLASSDASFITGLDLKVDGGFTVP